MNTPAHLIIGAAALARKDRRGSLSAALGGAIVPDLSLYLLVGWQLGVVGTSADIVFRDLYYSDSWQSIFAIDNSIFLWALMLTLALLRGWSWLRVFSTSALLHLALDLPFHAGDGRPHFWPLSSWVFDSPISYWDERHFGWLIGPAELLACAMLTLLLMQRFRSIAPRLLFAALFAFELASSGIWMLMF